MESEKDPAEGVEFVINSVSVAADKVEPLEADYEISEEV